MYAILSQIKNNYLVCLALEGNNSTQNDVCVKVIKNDAHVSHIIQKDHHDTMMMTCPRVP
jgi:hypothetical protein